MEDTNTGERKDDTFVEQVMLSSIRHLVERMQEKGTEVTTEAFQEKLKDFREQWFTVQYIMQMTNNIGMHLRSKVEEKGLEVTQETLEKEASDFHEGWTNLISVCLEDSSLLENYMQRAGVQNKSLRTLVEYGEFKAFPRLRQEEGGMATGQVPKLTWNPVALRDEKIPASLTEKIGTMCLSGEPD